MIRSILIVEGNKEKRWKKAWQLARESLGKSLSLSHPDFLLLEGSNSISIAQIRNLERKLALKPYAARVKIALIHEAEKLTLPAQNALLKTLEEPPENSLIILTVPQAAFLLPTIISRCQVIRLKNERKTKIESEKIVEISKKGIGERLKIAGFYSRTKAQADKFCEQLLFAERQKMLKEPTAQKARNIGYILETLLMLRKNVNPTLATGNLLLKLL